MGQTGLLMPVMGRVANKGYYAQREQLTIDHVAVELHKRGRDLLVMLELGSEIGRIWGVGVGRIHWLSSASSEAVSDVHLARRQQRRYYAKLRNRVQSTVYKLLVVWNNSQKVPFTAFFFCLGLDDCSFFVAWS